MQSNIGRISIGFANIVRRNNLDSTLCIMFDHLVVKDADIQNKKKKSNIILPVEIMGKVVVMLNEIHKTVNSAIS